MKSATPDELSGVRLLFLWSQTYFLLHRFQSINYKSNVFVEFHAQLGDALMNVVPVN